MSLQKPEFNIQDVEVIAEESLYQGFFKLNQLSLRHRLYSGGWSAPLSRELFDKALDQAVAAVVYDPVHDLIGLTEQFRVGMMGRSDSPWSLEGVAGLLDSGETPESQLRRELVEEAGITECQLVPITQFYPTPGSCNEFVYLFCALCDLRSADGIYGVADEGEDIRFSTFEAEDVFRVMYNSRLGNAFTLIGLQWLQANRDRLQSEVYK